MRARIALLVSLLAAAAAVAGCITIGGSAVDNALPGNVRDRGDQLRQAKEVALNGWDAYKAWDHSVDNLSGFKEEEIGQASMLMSLARFNGMVLSDEELLRYVNDVANYIAVASAPNPNGEKDHPRVSNPPRIVARRVFVAIVKDPAPNAVSFPGGHILVTTGLLESINSEAELAFVLAHEIAHVDLEHSLGAIKKAAGLDGVLTAEIKKRLNDKVPVKNLLGEQSFFNSAALVLFNSIDKANLFSKEQEKDADLRAIQYMARAGYDPTAATRVMEILATNTANSKSRSHGTPAERTEYLRKPIKKAQDGGAGKTGYTRWQERGLPRVAALTSEGS